MKPTQLLDRLVALFPEFRSYWDSNNYGSFTLHGVFEVFTGFHREQHGMHPDTALAGLGTFVPECMALDVNGLLDNAVTTCFLENIVGEPAGDELLQHLTGPAKWYWRHWGARDADPNTVRVPAITDADVRRVVSAIFPESDRLAVQDALNCYDPNHEGPRVRLAVLALADGNAAQVGPLVAAANENFREVLAWAEYPEISGVGSTWKMVAWYGRLGLG